MNPNDLRYQHGPLSLRWYQKKEPKGSPKGSLLERRFSTKEPDCCSTQSLAQTILYRLLMWNLQQTHGRIKEIRPQTSFNV